MSMRSSGFLALWSPTPPRNSERGCLRCNRRIHTTRMTENASGRKETITVLDYGAGNVRSLQNAINFLGFDIKWVETAKDIETASKLVFPGVGSFGVAMENLKSLGFIEPLTEYVKADRPFLGICLGLQTLFEESEESPGVKGLGVFPGTVQRFQFDTNEKKLAIPHIGWNYVRQKRSSVLLERGDNHNNPANVPDRFYFVHSYRVGLDTGNLIPGAVLGTTTHGEEFLSVLQHGRICATQFHPEKSGSAGLELIENFLSSDDISEPSSNKALYPVQKNVGSSTELAKRVVACLDVRENDDGDLVVTKGDQYDVREKSNERGVRNLGKPVELAHRYFQEGADEVCFLNITSFRGEPVGSAPMIEVLEKTSEGVFVPLCIGGGIRDYVDRNGTAYSALDVASMYFRAGADKVSLGSDAVYAAERYYERGGEKDGTSSIEKISNVYGAQAVVVSVDPRRVYAEAPSDTPHSTIRLDDGRYCWYQCTVKGGREGRDLDVVELAMAVEDLGAGEILINSMDQDGQKNGFDCNLIKMIRNATTIPVIASSGAGCPSHFTECFDETGAEAALAAGIFHRNEVSIQEVKEHMEMHGTPVRKNAASISMPA